MLVLMNEMTPQLAAAVRAFRDRIIEETRIQVAGAKIPVLREVYLRRLQKHLHSELSDFVTDYINHRRWEIGRNPMGAMRTAMASIGKELRIR